MRRFHFSLAVRLTATTLVVTAVVSVLLATITTSTVRATLTAQVDVRLADAGALVARDFAAGRYLGASPDGPPPSFLQSRQALGTLGAVRVDGQLVSAGFYKPSGSQGQLSAKDVETLRDAPTTVRPAEFVLSTSAYRYVTLSPTAGVELIVGLPLSDVDRSIATLVLVEFIVVISVLGLAAVAAYGLSRWNLRPLRRIAAVAQEVSRAQGGGDLVNATRVSEADSDSSTEVAAVARALNNLLDSTRSAVVAQLEREHQLRKFIGDFSHEARTPLAAVAGYAELAERFAPTVSEPVQISIAEIRKGATRLTNLVERMLFLVRAQTRESFNPVPVEVEGFLRSLFEEASARDNDRDWSFTSTVGALTLKADQERLSAGVRELLDNAARHTPPGTHVSISATREGDNAALAVSDNGPGIAQTALDTVADEFNRPDSSRDRRNGGAGLGLSIARVVSELHGGSLRITSNEGITSFVILLPIGTARS